MVRLPMLGTEPSLPFHLPRMKDQRTGTDKATPSSSFPSSSPSLSPCLTQILRLSCTEETCRHSLLSSSALAACWISAGGLARACDEPVGLAVGESPAAVVKPEDSSCTTTLHHAELLRRRSEREPQIGQCEEGLWLRKEREEEVEEGIRLGTFRERKEEIQGRGLHSLL